MPLRQYAGTLLSFWVAAADLFPVNGATLATLGTSPNAVRVVELDDAAVEGALFTLAVPRDYTNNAFVYATPYWSPSADATTAKAVKWRVVSRWMIDGQLITPGTNVSWTGISATRAVDTVVKEARTKVNALAGSYRPIRMAIHRMGNDTADTYVGAVRLLGVMIEVQGPV